MFDCFFDNWFFFGRGGGEGWGIVNKYNWHCPLPTLLGFLRIQKVWLIRLPNYNNSIHMSEVCLYFLKKQG